ncbi:TraR/DksA family transcriptional regulator [Afifella pfennigii]|uniref:TraR/DksA family transcriptional regulator n=1 Tax=Afifella pfennigii TaxID=209897 RepID=UPI0005534B00|nr:TraR/DksA C4-type zinc finger protein [Afifella pfennigii]
MDELEPAEMEELRRRILDELAELTAVSAAAAEDSRPVTLDQQSVGRLSRMDAMQRQAMALASSQRREARLRGLKSALARMEAGEYGFCLTCEEPIAIGRLRADPIVRSCLACARLG